MEEAGGEEHFVPTRLAYDSKNCSLCGEKFKLGWNEDSDEWVYENAILDEDETVSTSIDCYHLLTFRQFILPVLNEAIPMLKGKKIHNSALNPTLQVTHSLNKMAGNSFFVSFVHLLFGRFGLFL